MSRAKAGWLLAGLLCLAVWWLVTPSTQQSRWEVLVTDAEKASHEGDPYGAEASLVAALEEAEKFGEQDGRLAGSLNNLAECYCAQGKYAQAEPLYQRSLAILEESYAAGSPDVAATLENYAALLREMGRDDEAGIMEVRAKAIRAKHAEESPPR